jgi:hypothetical protein
VQIGTISVLKYVLAKDRVMLDEFLKFLLLSSEVRSSDLINNVDDFKNVLELGDELSNKFIQKCIVETKQTMKVTGLNLPDNVEQVVISNKSQHLIATE